MPCTCLQGLQRGPDLAAVLRSGSNAAEERQQQQRAAPGKRLTILKDYDHCQVVSHRYDLRLVCNNFIWGSSSAQH